MRQLGFGQQVGQVMQMAYVVEDMQAASAGGFARPEPRMLITDTITLEETPDIFDALRGRTHQCKVLIAP